MMSEKREGLLFLFRAFDFQIDFFSPPCPPDPSVNLESRSLRRDLGPFSRRDLSLHARDFSRLSLECTCTIVNCRLWKWTSAKGGEKGADERGRAGEGNKSGRGGR